MFLVRIVRDDKGFYLTRSFKTPKAARTFAVRSGFQSFIIEDWGNETAVPVEAVIAH